MNMKKTVDFLKKDPSRQYTLADFEKLKLLPWARDQRTVKKLLDADKKGSNVLKAKITGTASQRRYLVEGTNLINYLLTYGPILIGTVRKPKHGKHT